MPVSQSVDLLSPLRPTNAERAAVLDQLASLETRLDDLAHQRNLALAHLDSLVSEKSLIETEMMHRKSFLHPIKFLPPNVLMRIFEIYVEAQPKGLGVLQCVSKEWNHIVKNLPTLWTSLHIVGIFRAHHANSWKRYIDACSLRSKKLPLKVRFFFKEDPKDEGDTLDLQGKTAFDLLSYLTLFVSSRWVSLEYTWIAGVRALEYRTRLHKLYQIIRQAQCLQVIHLRDSYELLLTNLYTPPHYHKPTYVSSLRTLDIHGLPWNNMVPEDPLPSIRELTLEWYGGKPWDDLMASQTHWLQLFPFLRCLTLRASNRLARFDVLSRFHPIPYTASDLQMLKIVGPVPPYVLKNLHLPALEALQIYENKGGEHILEEERCITWFYVVYDFGHDIMPQLVCLGPELS
ncbi:14913_t:CDS:1 [Acaulospora colombiana]|uniref:14913_t:CDS:1 n=1 Tax=Acaulospora colombiana TaxID=27376 RepID=A0ACA9PA33_9GLOM|nr:14913_t:CDS:1 [Acaulospora colombiana]